MLMSLLSFDIVFFIKGEKIFVDSSNQSYFLYYMLGISFFLQTLFLSHYLFPTFIQDNKKWLKENKVSFFFYSALIIGFALTYIDFKTKNIESSEFWNNVLVEAHGMFFDIILFGIILTVYERYSHKHNENENLQNEIDDFRFWNADEAKFRIRGNLFRLNKGGVTKINLSFIDLSNVELRKVILNNSNFCETNLSNSNMENSEFNNILCSNSKFTGKNTILLNASFKNAHIQNSDFSQAYLNGANFCSAKLSKINFSKADLRNVDLQNVHLYEPNFNDAEVSSDFTDKILKWNIIGFSILDNYEIVKKAVIGHAGHFQYFLKSK